MHVVVEVACVDGSVLTLLPVPVRDRTGAVYETTLRLLRDGQPFGHVGECSGWQLTRTLERLRDLQQQHGPGAFPPPAWAAALDDGLVDGEHRLGLRRLLPRDSELLCLRARDPDDGDPSGELRLWVREDRTWHDGQDGARGRWSLTARAVLDAWGREGTGVRAVLDGPALVRLLDDLLEQARADGEPERLQAGAGRADPPV